MTKFQNTENRVENLTCSGVFLRNVEVFRMRSNIVSAAIFGDVTQRSPPRGGGGGQCCVTSQKTAVKETRSNTDILTSQSKLNRRRRRRNKNNLKNFC